MGTQDQSKSVAVAPDGRTVLSGGETIKLWDMSTGKLLRSFNYHMGIVSKLAFSMDGQIALSAGYGTDRDADRTIGLWDVRTGKNLSAFGSGPVESAALAPDGRTALSASAVFRGTLELWDAPSGKLLRTFEGRVGGVTSLAFSPDGRFAFSGGEKLQVWDVATGKLLRTIKGSGPSQTVAFSRDGRSVLTGLGTLKLWDMSTGKLLSDFEEHTDFILARCAFSGWPERTLWR